MDEKEQSCHQIMISVIDEICDKYCKYPDMYVSKNPDMEEDMLEEMMYTEICANCPMNRLA